MEASLVRRVGRSHRQNDAIAYLLLVPALIGLLVFKLGPLIASAVLSFTRWSVIRPPEWIGLENYARLGGHRLVWRSVSNTIYYTLLTVPAQTLFAIVLAGLLNSTSKLASTLRLLFFLPVVSSSVAIATVWGWLFNGEQGLINYGLRLALGIDGPAWLADPVWAMPAVSGIGIWSSIGIGMVIFIASFRKLPKSLYEAATLEGASPTRRFLSITVPLVAPTTAFVLVTNTISSLKVFSQVYTLTQGGPQYSTLTLGYFIYTSAFAEYQMGFASALAFLLFFVIAAFTAIGLAASRRSVHGIE